MRIEAQPGYVLHSAPYRETSLLVDLFTEHYGRVKCVAKGFRKPSKKGVSKVLFPYTEHYFHWQGRGDLKTLIKADAVQAPVFLHQESLFVGLYLNEVLYKLLHQYDPHQSLYQHYSQLMCQLSTQGLEQDLLRRFEIGLLDELGYGLVLDSEADFGKPISPERLYQYIPEHGLRETKQSSTNGDMRLKGADIIAIAEGNFEQQSVLKAAKQLTRQVIDFYLDGRKLNSRELYRQHLLEVDAKG